MCRCRSVVEGSKDSGRTPFFYEITHDLVVEIFNRGPFDLFPNILLLFRFEGQFDEDLLELLINVVDT